MKTLTQVDIKDYLAELGVDLSEISLGTFDEIGEVCARKSRGKTSENYHKNGCFFRPNYERGILIYYLVKTGKVKSMLEIGFGRGMASVCAAMAMHDNNIEGHIDSIDITIDKDHIAKMRKAFPEEWLDKIVLHQGTSEVVLRGSLEKGNYDLIYIDGDHSAEGVALDIELTRDRWNKYILFDDYHLNDNEDFIQCRKPIDDAGFEDPKLILMDRRIFHDDKGLSQLDYGQLLVTK